MCLVDTGSSADCCLTLSSAAWLLIGPEASTSRRPSDQIQMWNERGRFDVSLSMFHMKQKVGRWAFVETDKEWGRGEGRDRRPFHSRSVFCESLFSCLCVFSFITLSALRPKDHKNVWHHHGDHNNYL